MSTTTTTTTIMCTMVPCKPAECVDNFATKYPKLLQAFPVSRRRRQSSAVRLSVTTPCTEELQSTRRSGNYRPTLWDFDSIQSLDSVYKEEKYVARASELVVQVKELVEQESSWFRQLELIDDLQRLGLSYHFEDEIRQILSCVYLDEKYCKKMDLYSTSLSFRLLRQHGFKVSQGMCSRLLTKGMFD